MHWVEGQLHARLGHPRRARKRLERARKAHVKRSPHHWALVIGIDEALHYSRHAGRPELHFHSIRRVITACANELKLNAELSGRLAELSQLLKEEPYHADRFISQFHRSFMTPVAGLLVDLTKPGVLDRKWPYGPDIATARRQRLPWGMANLSNG